MKIAFFQLEDWQKELARERLESHELLFFDHPQVEREIEQLHDIDVLAVFIYSTVNASLLDSLPQLRLVATMSTGFDHIDIEACKNRDIAVTNVPGYGENTVAEHTFALILALSRRIYSSIRRTQREHSFETDTALRGFDICGRTLGLIGCGRIGRHVARIAKGFSMRVMVYDAFPNEELAQEIGFEYQDMSTVLESSDIISLHAPLNEHTYHLMNEKTLSQAKEGAILINTGRGGLVDTAALVTALREGEIGAAALDVLEEEAAIKEEMAVLSDCFKEKCNYKAMLQGHVLMKMDNVIVTPHNAFNSWEAVRRIIDKTLDNIAGLEAGELLNRVDA